MAVTYRRGRQNPPPRAARSEPRRRLRRTVPDPAVHRPAPPARPVSADPREARCELLARRIVILGTLSLLMFIAGFFLTIPHAILGLSLPLSLAFCARHRLDLLQEELQREAGAGRSAAAAPPAEPLTRAA